MRIILTTGIWICLLPYGAQCQAPSKQDAIRITRRSAQAPQAGPADNFTGSVQVESPFRGESPARVSGAQVTFEAGARTAWHSHPLGQTLIVTAGVGRVQRWGNPFEEIRTGDVVWIPPGQKHWHGAAPSSSMKHIAITEQLDGKTVDWMEKVSDAQYGVAASPEVSATAQPSRAQMLMGDIAPKLAQLTDDVLFADVWARPQLSQRDRSLVTVAALIAMNRPEQLRSHLARARTNGLTQEELVEAITHLAFYSGWPNAISAVGVAREVFKESK